MIAVLDASMAVNIIRKAPVGLAAIETLVKLDRVIAPSFFRLEAASALCKYTNAGVIKTTEAMELFRQGCSLVDEFYEVGELMDEVILESVRLKHSVYDLPYLVLARRNGAALFTCDKRLYNLAAECGVWVYSDFNQYEKNC